MPAAPTVSEAEAAGPRSAREIFIVALSALLGAYVFYSAFFGAFESLIQRAGFVAVIGVLGLAMFPLGGGSPGGRSDS
ncbi:hypothetical protein [Amorphus orientalis]|uniref:Uncharacterized protein n=1 Tax=Amorphus orientalis TaxID=649198 RepID=A0AAE3VSF2_9HYPH|nr:hypothetical protein [Amorphus orientalis]MDQ0317507.1 hypothetical protein [Amorphus orientalis]